MADFQSRVLSTLSAIYNFVGGERGVGKVDLASPIALVHNVSELAAGNASLMVEVRHSQVTAGGSAPMFITIEVADLFDATLPMADTQLAALGRRPENTDVYLMEIGAVVTAPGTTLQRIGAGAEPPDNGRYVNVVGQPRWLIWGDSEENGSALESGGALQIRFNSASAGEVDIKSQPWARLPMRVERVSLFAEDDGVGVVTVTWMEVFAFVPIGTGPPRAS